MEPTNFQVACEAAITKMLKARGAVLKNRQLYGVAEPYIYGEIAEIDAKLWIYVDEAELEARGNKHMYEHPDYPNDQDLINAFASAVQAYLHGKSPDDAGSSRIVISRHGPL